MLLHIQTLIRNRPAAQRADITSQPTDTTDTADTTNRPHCLPATADHPNDHPTHMEEDTHTIQTHPTKPRGSSFDLINVALTNHQQHCLKQRIMKTVYSACASRSDQPPPTPARNLQKTTRLLLKHANTLSVEDNSRKRSYSHSHANKTVTETTSLHARCRDNRSVCVTVIVTAFP
jgi:hypothetical protein